MIISKLPGLNGNAYSASKYLYESIKVTKEATIASYDPLTEAIDWEVDQTALGGVIIFSTDINALELNSNKVINWIKQKAGTLVNRLGYKKKIDKIAVANNAVGWTVGKFLEGRYKAKNGNTYGENSLAVEIVGITSQQLIKIAEELCKEFTQESVMIKDYTSGNILFVNSAEANIGRD